MKLSEHFKQAVSILKDNGINFVYVSDSVDFESEYPVGSMHVPTGDFSVVWKLMEVLWDWSSPTGNFVISYNYNGDESVVDSLVDGKHPVSF